MMMPLATPNQGGLETIIQIPQGEYLNGVRLHEVFKTVMKREPRQHEKVKFNISSDTTIIGSNIDLNAITLESSWPGKRDVTLSNSGVIMGRGGAGGLGAYLLSHYSSRNKFTRIGPEDGYPGGNGVVNQSPVLLNVLNRGKIYGGGGGGAGGAAWWWVLPTMHRDRPQWTGRNGASSGGGAPYGKRSQILGSVEWMLKVDSAPGEYQNNLNKVYSTTLLKDHSLYNISVDGRTGNGTWFYIRNDATDFLSAHLGGQLRNDSISLKLKGTFKDLGGVLRFGEIRNFGGSPPPALKLGNPTAISTSRPDHIYRKPSYIFYDKIKEHQDLNLIYGTSHAGPQGVLGAVGMFGYMNTDGELHKGGLNGSGLGHDSYAFGSHSQDPPSYRWVGANDWYGPNANATNILDDNWGGRGGNPGENGGDAYILNPYYQRLGWANGQPRPHVEITRVTTAEFLSNRGNMIYVPAGKPGQAGYIASGNVSLSNLTGGEIKGRNASAGPTHIEFYWTKDAAGQVKVDKITSTGRYYCWVNTVRLDRQDLYYYFDHRYSNMDLTITSGTSPSQSPSLGPKQYGWFDINGSHDNLQIYTYLRVGLASSFDAPSVDEYRTHIQVNF